MNFTQEFSFPLLDIPNPFVSVGGSIQPIVSLHLFALLIADIWGVTLAFLNIFQSTLQMLIWPGRCLGGEAVTWGVEHLLCIQTLPNFYFWCLDMWNTPISVNSTLGQWSDSVEDSFVCSYEWHLHSQFGLANLSVRKLAPFCLSLHCFSLEMAMQHCSFNTSGFDSIGVCGVCVWGGGS